MAKFLGFFALSLFLALISTNPVIAQIVVREPSPVLDLEAVRAQIETIDSFKSNNKLIIYQEAERARSILDRLRSYSEFLLSENKKRAAESEKLSRFLVLVEGKTNGSACTAEVVKGVEQILGERNDSGGSSSFKRLEFDLLGETLETQCATIAKYKESINSIKAENEKVIRENDATMVASKELASVVRKKFESLTSQLNEADEEIIWKIVTSITLITAMGGVIFYLVGRFDYQLQLLMFESGQVVQFITIMILLSTIISLGIGRIIGEQALSTLLGSIAGYVLAQGVAQSKERSNVPISEKLNSSSEGR
jgi:hypothetical protein